MVSENENIRIKLNVAAPTIHKVWIGMHFGEVVPTETLSLKVSKSIFQRNVFFKHKKEVFQRRIYFSHKNLRLELN